MKVNSSLPRDNNHIAIQANNAFLTQDGTGTPVTSPLTVATVQTLVVPPGAVRMICTALVAPVRVSELAAATRYLTIPLNTSVILDVVNMTNVYAVQDTAGGILSFAFLYI